MPEQAPLDQFETRLSELLRVHTAVAERPVVATEVARMAMAPSARRVDGGMIRSLDRRLAWSFVAIAALIALVASLAFVGAQRRAPDVLRMLPDELPADLPHGTIDTPIGQARWVHLTGDPRTLPDPLVPMIGPSGLIWVDYGGPRSFPCDDPEARSSCTVDTRPGIWTSDDALGPRVEQPLPVDAVSISLMQDQDAYWLATTDPPTLWHAPDVTGWQPIDLTGLVSPGPSELEWGVSPGQPVTAHGIIVVPVTYQARDVARLVGYPGLVVHIEKAGVGVYRVLEHHARSEGGDTELGFVRVDQTPTGLRFSNESGGTIAELAGVGPELVESWSTTGSILEQQIGAVDGSRLTALDVPWSSAEAPTIFPTASGFVAFVVNADKTVSPWRSDDGLSWTEGPRLGDAGGQPWTADGVWSDLTLDTPEVSVVMVGDGDRWTSTDAEHWTFVPARSATDPFWDAARIGSGWVRASEGSIWVSRDDSSRKVIPELSSWKVVPELWTVITKWTPRGAGSSGTNFVGNAAFVMVVEDSVPMERDLWIIEWEPPQG